MFVAVVAFAFAHVVDEDGESAFARGEVYEVVEKEPTGAAALAQARAREMEFDNPLADNPPPTIQQATPVGNEQPGTLEQEEGAPPKPGVPALRAIVEKSEFEAFILETNVVCEAYWVQPLGSAMACGAYPADGPEPADGAPSATSSPHQQSLRVLVLRCPHL